MALIHTRVPKKFSRRNGCWMVQVRSPRRRVWVTLVPIVPLRSECNGKILILMFLCCFSTILLKMSVIVEFWDGWTRFFCFGHNLRLWAVELFQKNLCVISFSQDLQNSQKGSLVFQLSGQSKFFKLVRLPYLLSLAVINSWPIFPLQFFYSATIAFPKYHSVVNFAIDFNIALARLNCF